MAVSRESQDDPALLEECAKRRYIWSAIGSWHKVRNDPTKHSQFYAAQETKLAEFDERNPGYNPPEILPANQRPHLPVKTMPAIVAQGKKLALPIPRPKPALPTPRPKPALPPAPPSKSPQIIVPETATQGPDSLAPETSNRRVQPRSPSPQYINRFAPLRQGMPDDAFGDEDAEGSDEDIPAATSKKDKGKEKRKEDEEDPFAKIKVKRVADPEPSQKRLPPVNSGRHRTPACKRCAKKKRTCYEQAGSGLACVGCAKIKMKCEDPSEDEMEVDIPTAKSSVPAQAPPTIVPAPATTKKAEPARKAPAAKKTAETTPAPPAKDAAPKKKRAPKKKTAPAPDQSDSDNRAEQNPGMKNRAPKRKPAPPAPAHSDTMGKLEHTGSKNRKVVKSNEYVNVTDSDDDFAEEIPAKKKRAPKKNPAPEQEQFDSDDILEVNPVIKNRAPKKNPAPAPAPAQDSSGSKNRKDDVTDLEDDFREEKLPKATEFSPFERYAGKEVY